MKKVFVISLLMTATLIVMAQKKKDQVIGDRGAIAYEQGKSYYDKSKYSEAIPHFEETLSSDGNNADALYYAGLCYRYTDQNEKAIEKFTKLANVNADYWSWFYYELGVAYGALNKVDESVSSFHEFEKRFPRKPANTNYFHKAQYNIHYYKNRQALLESPVVMKDPVKLSRDINSDYDDYTPILDPTGARLYFSSQRLGGITREDASAKEGDDDIYMMEKVNGVWSTPKLLPEPINSSNNDGAQCFSADGQMMVYTACGRDQGIGSCDLYISMLEGDQWTTPVNLGDIVNSKEWDSQPSISSDGNRIFFTSTRDDGYGGEDLYMTERNIFGEWGPAMNLGGIINTPFDEQSPFMSQDGKTLYFASTGHPGFGGYDLFKTTYENGKWSIPVNLGGPLNTSGSDRYFTIGGSGEIGYFSSDRGGSNLDLYEIEIPEEMRPQPTVVVSGTVTNAKTGKAVGAYVMVEDINTGELIAVNKSNSATGKYLVVLPSGRSYSVSANKEAFFFHSERFDVPSSTRFEEIRKDIALKPIEKGAKVVLNNIFFETGKATLSSESRVELNKAVDLMKANPTMIIEVGGHTDNVGDDAYNMKLSHDRAKAVRDYLVSAGIASGRVQSKGYGESNPVATNDTDDGRKANRRTEFVILEF